MKTLAALALATALPFTGLILPLPAPTLDDERPARGALVQRLAERFGGRLRQGLDDLDVNDAQRDAMRATVEQHRDALRDAVRAELDARRALREAAAARPTDASAIHVASQRLATAMAEARIASGLLRDDVRAQLTPEQLVELDAQRADRLERLDDLRAHFER